MIFAPPPPLPPYVDAVEAEPPAGAAPVLAAGTLIARLGAYPTRAAAEEALLVVQISAGPEALPVHVRPEPTGARARFRLVAGPLDAAAADRLCRRLHAARQPCIVSDTAQPPPEDQGSP